MNSKKRTDIKRIILFCVIVFLPLSIAVPLLNAAYGEMIFASENTLVVAQTLGIFGMFAPSLANLLTRLITREGFKDSYLGLHFTGNAGYYIASIVVKLLETAACTILIWLVFMKGLSFGEAFPAENINAKIGTLLLQLALSIIIFFPAFGEEWGWRGYLMPKLMQVMNKPAAIITGGVIWGLWHAPLTISGHNFGVDYPFYPWLGILLMCVMCTIMNAFLTLLTEKTKSIYPASFCHMINNNLSFGIMLTIFGSEAAIEKVSELTNVTAFLVYLPILAITGIVSYILLIKKEKP